MLEGPCLAEDAVVELAATLQWHDGNEKLGHLILSPMCVLNRACS